MSVFVNFGPLLRPGPPEFEIDKSLNFPTISDSGTWWTHIGLMIEALASDTYKNQQYNSILSKLRSELELGASFIFDGPRKAIVELAQQATEEYEKTPSDATAEYVARIKFTHIAVLFQKELLQEQLKKLQSQGPKATELFKYAQVLRQINMDKSDIIDQFEKDATITEKHTFDTFKKLNEQLQSILDISKTNLEPNVELASTIIHLLDTDPSHRIAFQKIGEGKTIEQVVERYKAFLETIVDGSGKS